ncbi:MAG: DsbA family oxidoreductase [Rhodospirillaceae bacterium]|nr:DsbA family oxidoreductase [Rhodospirillaceae bacterium]MYH35178.1 DsbA family oxidoreductase [Rhodospirillaceae bacterium]MYK15309.1 DsbA family oxidoreductase [Rhodospirillaceae bacterium]MYK57423.1 DsbA family oxidoreductase [Rhodospirillaceae bacterium]
MSRKITVDIVSDTVCPWCYVGKRRFEEALARRPPDLDVYVGWRPFQLNPDMPAEGMDRKAYLAAKFGGDERAEHIYSAIVEAGASTGLDFDFAAMPRQPNTLDSHRLIDRAGRAAESSGGRPGLQDAVVERLFRACFIEGRDIGDRETLVELAADAGMDADETRAYLESDVDAERIRQEDRMARQMGIQGVPCFIINRQYAVSGAQEPAVFLKAFEQVLEAEKPAVNSPEPAPA